MVTKRTKNLKKQEIPSLDDPISKLNHIGKETVKKLNELEAAAAEAEIDLRLPPDLHQCGLLLNLRLYAAYIAKIDGAWNAGCTSVQRHAKVFGVNCSTTALCCAVLRCRVEIVLT